MALTVDHLRTDAVVKVIRAFRDAGGRVHPPGEQWTLRGMSFDPATLHLTMTVAGDDGTEQRFVLDLKDVQGPRIGRMREWFEAGEPGGSRPEHHGSRVVRQAVPEPLQDVCRLAEAGRWDDARQALQPLFERREFAGENLPNLAGLLEHATACVFPGNHEAACWLYQQAIQCWHGWGALATSGGDGAARMPDIKAALARQQKLFGPA